jgi:HlyD family secretion protein
MKFLWQILFFVLCGTGLYFYWKRLKEPVISPFLTSSLERRTIKQQIHAVGVLEIKDTLKVGSLVAGTVAEIKVKEHQKVAKGELLAVIDNGKGRTEVKEAEAALAKAKASLIYHKKKFIREKALFEQQHRSEQEFEKIEETYLMARADHQLARATLEKKEREFTNLNIVAPIDGTIVSVGITVGQRITTDLDATVLFRIARDLSVMHGILEIDESDIGSIEIGQKVSLCIESYPYKTFRGTIVQVRYSPESKGGVLFYHATVEINNEERLLRPGMSLQARIHVGKEKNILALTTQALSLCHEKLCSLIGKHKISLIPLPSHEKKKILKEFKNKNIQFIWILSKDSCKEIPVLLGITDDLYFSVLEGVSENDKIIYGVQKVTRSKKHSLF